ncbi:MAG: hypothetical protein IPL53_17780 [Ignavibacteria bacterium]|nr:hypothetical protein [Ignavibacteria bacterium]
MKIRKIGEDFIDFFKEKKIYNADTDHLYAKGIFVFSNKEKTMTLGIEPLIKNPDKYIVDYDVQFDISIELINLK